MKFQLLNRLPQNPVIPLEVTSSVAMTNTHDNKITKIIEVRRVDYFR